MEYLSDSIMLEMLKKVQQQQVEILKTDRSAHLDSGVHENLHEYGHHISFDLNIYENNSHVRDFEFSSTMSQEELDAEYACLAAYVNRIKKEAE